MHVFYLRLCIVYLLMGVLVYGVSVRVFVVCARFAIDSQQPPEPPVFVYSLLLPFPGPELIPFPLHPFVVWHAATRMLHA